MAHYLTFDSTVTCKVNGTAVSSGYELHDGDVIVASVDVSYDVLFRVNSTWYSKGSTVDVSDLDVEVAFQSQSGGGGNIK